LIWLSQSIFREVLTDKDCIGFSTAKSGFYRELPKGFPARVKRLNARAKLLQSRAGKKEALGRRVMGFRSQKTKGKKAN